ncbi:hypothetical protein [Novosphingobium lindaniclasticum]|uniref:Uncharacterized protein n=1 Tax=Novosphingobium lindaniclasticum LE124 TaxID=1096930 RepID=T0IJ55_9SPHN|nr:hypothetical protein [Novosphingobium lindaniclasticum]EQB09689.1 hypothetical protein L284_18985 [Novosphingobium lindaniclasticum LE124]
MMNGIAISAAIRNKARDAPLIASLARRWRSATGEQARHEQPIG